MSTTASGEPRDGVLGTASLWSVLRAGRGAYAAEAVGLAGFLLVVGIVDSVVFAPESPVSGAIGSDWVKRAIVGAPPACT
jgi:hypothetical protein